MKKNCQCVHCGQRTPCEEMVEGLCVECQRMFEDLEEEDDEDCEEGQPG